MLDWHLIELCCVDFSDNILLLSHVYWCLFFADFVCLLVFFSGDILYCMTSSVQKKLSELVRYFHVLFLNMNVQTAIVFCVVSTL